MAENKTNSKQAVRSSTKKTERENAVADIPFEDALTRLDEIVRLLENGAVTLDKSLAYFEEGVRLIKQCNHQLDFAEQRIRVLTRDADGSVIEKDFDPETSAVPRKNETER